MGNTMFNALVNIEHLGATGIIVELWQPAKLRVPLMPLGKGNSMKCQLCEDTGWVCENHPDQPWEGPHACTCGGAGAPCPACNRSAPDEPPRLPKGFEPDHDR
jgi:hypothetical protein